MITIKNKSALAKMEHAGTILSGIFENMKELIKPGVSTLEIDEWIEKQLRAEGMVPRSKGYCSYKHASCISINDVVIHGVPDSEIMKANADISNRGGGETEVFAKLSGKKKKIYSSSKFKKTQEVAEDDMPTPNNSSFVKVIINKLFGL